MVVSAPAGTFTGYYENDSVWFRGIRYATADRFRPPRPAGPKDKCCRTFGAKSLQPTRDGMGHPVPGPFSEDCLFLNVVVPAEKPEGLMPVVVDIHGGAFQTGSGNDSAVFSLVTEEKAKIVAVSINYRLGALGYLFLRDSLGAGFCDGNMGLLDQICALRWVHDNIEAFGGDPGRVTLYGVSAGGKSVGALMLSEQSKPLFSQAILSSGGVQAVRTPETASRLAGRFLTMLQLKDNWEILTIPSSLILKVQSVFTAGPGSTCLFGPVADGEVIPADWRDVIRSDRGWKGNTMIGNNLNELVFLKMGGELLRNAPMIAAQLLGDNGEYAEKAYRALTGGKLMLDEEREDAWVKVLSDCMYRTHGDRLGQILASRGAEVYTYSFDFPPAHHSQDAMTLHHGSKAPSIGEPRSAADKHALDRIMHEMRASYIAFIENGDPNHDAIPRWDPVEPGSYGRLHFDRETYFDKPTGCPSVTDFPDESIDLPG